MDGKIAIVTGAAQGLGKAYSEALLERGAKVILSDVNTDLGTKTTEEFISKYGRSKVSFKKCDVVSKTDMEDLFELAKSQYGRLDIVVNNAGICHEGNWELMVDVNLKGMIRGTMLGIKHMSRDNGGSGGLIINMCSAAGILPTPFLPVYAATKHGILSYARSITSHPEHVKTGVRINCLCPFAVDTEIINYDEDMVCSLELAQQATDFTGVLPVSKVVDAFVDVLNDEEQNGEAILISTKGVRSVPQQYKNFNDMTQGSV